MEVVDIDLDNIPFSQDFHSVRTTNLDKPSVSFGGGIELLMNDKKRSSHSATKIGMDDLDNLESELNDLSKTTTPESSKSISGLSGFGNMFGFQSAEPVPVPASIPQHSLGQATKETGHSASSTWDGFSKVGDDIPKSESSARSSANMSERDKRRKKRLMLKKLEEWSEKGQYKHMSSFNMESNYDEIEDEYEGALEEKRKKDAIKLQGWWFTTVINTLEYGNALVNPFDLNLDGWGEQISDDLDSYEEIFAELHEKYKGGKMAPEVSLLLRVGFSAAVVNMSNKMLSSATPGFSDVMKQSPELMKMFSTAAVETMSKQNSAFDFAKTMMNPPDEINRRNGPPPAPVKTKKQAPPNRPGNMQFSPHPGNRPDLAAASNPMFRESGIDLAENKASNYNDPQKSLRPEMRGPQTSPDIDQLLSGLKPKRTEIFSAPPTFSPAVTTSPTVQAPVVEEMPMRGGSESIISLSSLKDLDGAVMPKKSSRKRNTSEKNTVALDI
jgi:hypothetical protein